MVGTPFPKEELNKTFTLDTEAPIMELDLSISNDIISTSIYDKRDDFDILKFPLLDRDIPPLTSSGVDISQLTR